MRRDMVYQNRKYLVRDKGPDGKIRWYVRMPGQKKVRLHSDPDTPAFDTEYWAARGEAKPVTPKIKVHSLTWLINQYYQSHAFISAAEATQTQRKSILGRIMRESGNKPYGTLTQDAVRAGRDKRASTPGAANNMLKTVKALYKWAKESGFVDHNPAVGVERLKLGQSTWLPWTPDQCAQYEATHPLGANARTAYAIARYGGYRRSDALRLGRQHRRNDELSIDQKKTGVSYTVIMSPNLIEALDACENTGLHYLLNEYGKPFSEKAFGWRFKKWVKEAGLPDHLSFHGLRKSRGIELAESGSTQEEVAASLGHSSVRTSEIYTKGANQKRLARQAQNKVNQEHNVQDEWANCPSRRKNT